MHSEADSMLKICDEMLHFKTNSCFSVPAAGFSCALPPDEIPVRHGQISFAQRTLGIGIRTADLTKGIGFEQIAAYIHQIKQTWVFAEQRVGHGTTPPFL